MSRLRRDEITLAQAPPEVAEVLWRCADARRLSEGWFDPWNTLGGLDPAGLLRGWAVGGALDVLRGAGVSAALIDAGGVVAAFGAPTPGRAWRVPVPGAEPPGHPCAMVEVSGSVATVVEGRRGTSAPHRGRPAGRNLRSVTVAGPDPVLAEALAVAVLSAGAGEGADRPGAGVRRPDRRHPGRCRHHRRIPGAVRRPAIPERRGGLSQASTLALAFSNSSVEMAPLSLSSLSRCSSSAVPEPPAACRT